MLHWRKLLLPIIGSLFVLSVHAQVTVEIIIEEGNATSDCRDPFGSPEHVWSVNVADQGWIDFDAEGGCNQLQSLPYVAYRATVNCPDEIETAIPIEFRAFENNPGIGNPCSTIRPSSCIAETGATFNFPTTEPSRRYTITLPTGGDAEGYVRFTMQVSGIFIGGENNVPCTAINLGVISGGTSVGSASRSVFNNYCGTISEGEPDPSTVNAGWWNNVGVWYSFRTNDNPGDRFQIIANSDPENTGDPIFLQIGLYTTSDNTCSGDFNYIDGSGGSSSDPDLNERFEFSCDDPLLPNTTYYILIDGVTDTREDLFGVFGLEVNAFDYTPATLDTILCAGEELQVFGQAYTTSGTYAGMTEIGFGCDSTVIINLTVLDPIVAAYTQTANASAENIADGTVRIDVIGGSGSYTINWSDGGNGTQRSDLIGGITYTVEIVDEQGCSTELSVPVEFNNLLTAQVSSDTLNCFGDQNGRLVIRVQQGEPPYDYTWQSLTDTELNGNGTIRREADIAGLTSLPAGEYEIRINDGMSPEVVLIGIVVQPEELIAAVTEQQAITCFEACDGQLEVSVSGGTAPYNLGIPNQIAGSNTAFVDNLCAGTFTTLVTDSKGCNVSLQATLEEPELLTISAVTIKDVNCFGGTDGNITIESNRNDVAFSWNNGELGATLTDLAAATYEVNAIDENGCTATSSFTIEQPEAPLEATIEIVQEITCVGATDGQLRVMAQNENGRVDYMWNDGKTSPTLDNLSSGEYNVEVEDENGCVAFAGVQLNEPEPISLIFSTKDIGCLDVDNAGAVMIESIDGGRAPYQLSTDGILFQTRDRISNLFEGTYDIIVRDANGCELTEVATIAGPSEVTVSLGDDLVVRLGQRVLLTAFTSAAEPIFAWQSEDSLSCQDCIEQQFMPVQNAVYTVTVTDAATQCSATDRIEILVDDTRELFVPNAFSPNGDNVNDRFTLYGGNMVTAINSLRIFNRRGQLVFESFDLNPNDESQGWDGILGNQFLPSDTYLYFAEVTFIDGRVVEYSGDVSLVR